MRWIVSGTRSTRVWLGMGRVRKLQLRMVLGLSLAALYAWAGMTAVGANASSLYEGKKVRFLVGTAAGAGFSTYALLLSRHMPRHIPGQPPIAVEHMPGAGGMNSLNYAANAAPKDGTVMAVAMPNFYVTPFTEPKGAKFDPNEFRFIGRISDFGRVLITWHTTGVRTIEDLKKKEVVIGASSRPSTTYVGPALINEILGTRMKIITGYRGTGPTLVAMESGEVGGTTVAWSTLTSLKADWLRDGKVHVVAGMDAVPVPRQGIPLIRDVITDPDKRALFDFVGLPALFGTAVLVAPGVPREATTILRAAFDATMRDKTFLADAEKAKLPVTPMSGVDLDALFAKSGNPSKGIVDRVADIMGVQKQ